MLRNVGFTEYNGKSNEATSGRNAGWGRQDGADIVIQFTTGLSRKSNEATLGSDMRYNV